MQGKNKYHKLTELIKDPIKYELEIRDEIEKLIMGGPPINLPDWFLDRYLDKLDNLYKFIPENQVLGERVKRKMEKFSSHNRFILGEDKYLDKINAKLGQMKINQRFDRNNSKIKIKGIIQEREDLLEVASLYYIRTLLSRGRSENSCYKVIDAIVDYKDIVSSIYPMRFTVCNWEDISKEDVRVWRNGGRV